MLVEVAGVPPLIPGHFQHFAQLLLHLLQVLLLYLGCHHLGVAHALAYDYGCLYSTYL